MEKTLNTINRRSFLKSGAVLAAGVSLRSRAAHAGRPPNVLFIICDQMRGDAMSCLGHPVARTPNLDKLAAKSVLFENAFANNPVCAPSRVTLFTGLYPHQHGKLTNKFGPFIDSLDNTMLGFFRGLGYKLGWVGKNHTLKKGLPAALDFADIRSREPFRAYNKFVPPFWHSDAYWPENQCHPYINTEAAIQFIKQNKETPFFLHVSYFDPHPPYMAAARYSSRYCSANIPLPAYVPPENLSPRLAEQARALHYDRISDADLKETMRFYYAAIEGGVDAQVGRLLKTLHEQNLADDTIIVFTADHGDFMGEFRMVRKGPFLYDALLHIPLIIHAPGRMQPGRRLQNLAQHVDVYPTLMDLAAGQKRDDLPGRSLAPLLQQDAADDEDFAVYASSAYSDLPSDYWQHPELAYQPNSDVPFHSRVQKLTWKAEQRTIMVRTARWKYIRNESRPPELYDMQSGREQMNVAGDNAHQAVESTLRHMVEKQWPW